MKPGDKVRVKEDSRSQVSGLNRDDYSHSIRAAVESNRSLTIRKISGFRVYFEGYGDEQEDWIPDVILEPVSELKVGDQVKAVSASGGWSSVSKGDVGIITSIDTGTWPITVDFPTREGWMCKEKDLEKVEYAPSLGVNTANCPCPADHPTLVELIEREEVGDQAYTVQYYKAFNESINKEDTMSLIKVPNSLKRVLNKNLKALYKVGWINGDLALTGEGKDELLQLLLEQNEDALGKLAQARAKEIEKENDKC